MRVSIQFLFLIEQRVELWNENPCIGDVFMEVVSTLFFSISTFISSCLLFYTLTFHNALHSHQKLFVALSLQKTEAHPTYFFRCVLLESHPPS
jgi:hypothetical protein